MGEAKENIKYDEEFISSPRGIKQFTCRWLPSNQEPKALIFLCHGYAMECSISMREKQENKMKKRFLLGESMGGAVALLLHRKQPTYWNGGAVLVAPMCKIADELKPHPMVTSLLQKMCRFIPTWKITPTQDIIDVAFKSPEKRNEIRNNPYCYKGRPRLKTAYELLMASLDIEKNLNQVSMPFLIVHGGDDIVTDPSVSKLLYESASSNDKAFRLYPGMWHALTSAEPPESIDLVFSHIFAWLEERRIVRPEASLEIEQKAKHEKDIQNMYLSSIVV